MQQTGSIYIIRNKINDKVYIGQTTMTVHERFMSHLKPSTYKKRGSYKIYNAIAKYGKENFYVETLETDIPVNELDEKEIKYIEKYDSFNNGYNSTLGGNVRRIYKPEDIEAIYKMTQEGKTFEEIGEMYGVHKMTIMRTLHGSGYYVHDQIDDNELTELFYQGYSNQELADILNTKKWTIERRLQRLGLRRRRIYIQNRTDINIEQIIEDYESGMPTKVICQKHDLDEKTYRKLKDDYYQIKER